MVDGVTDMGSYLRTYGRSLAQRITDQAEPLYTPGEAWDDRLDQLLKTPYQAQGDAVMGVSRLLDRSRSAVVVGEMGCGKTLMGLAVPYVHGPKEKPARTLVMCPGHLVRKWEREAVETIPGADATIIRQLGDVLDLDRRETPTRPEYMVVSKDRAKLGYAWKPGVLEKRDGYCCPNCDALILDTDGVPVEYGYLKRNRRQCTGCEGPLWQADNTRIRRYPISEYVKNHLNGYFDYLIADEVHELKGGDTAQGHSFGALASACGKTIALTGTLLGGYADDIFYVLYRLSPDAMKADGLEYGQVTQWMSRYGVLERITKHYPEDNVYSKGRRGSTRAKRKPGVSPAVFSKHLLDKTVFVSLEDIASDLPALSETVEGIDMDEGLAEAYAELEDTLSSAMREALARGDRSLLGSYINTLLSYPDRPFDNDPILHPHTEEIIAVPAELAKDVTYRKERFLIDLVKDSLDRGDRAFVYAQYTGTKDVTGRLQEVLGEEGIDAAILRSTVPPEKREGWLRQTVDDGAQAVIGNPRLVQTGLDLYDFPILIFYQTGYSIYGLRQASRRSWRIGQTRDVDVRYLYYRPTLQESAMRLMGSKLQASLALEGRFSEDGLLAMTQGEDMTTALARALVDGLESEGVEQLWGRSRNTSSPHAATDADAVADGLLFHVPSTRGPMERTRRRRARRRGEESPQQLRLLDDG